LTFNGKQEDEFIKWTEKDMADAYLGTYHASWSVKKSTHPKFCALELWLVMTMAM
jgi:hypothetical protein